VRRSTDERAHRRPVHGQRELEGDVAEHDRHHVDPHSAQAAEHGRNRPEQQHQAGEAQRRITLPAAPGEEHQHAKQEQHIYIHQRQGGNAQMHSAAP